MRARQRWEQGGEERTWELGSTEGLWICRMLESPGMPVPPLSMLRVRSENGEQVFLLMMRPEDTIGDVRNLLAQAR